MLWDIVKVKLQSPTSPTAVSHDIHVEDLRDARGDSSLNRLQDAILKKVGGGTDLKLSLSYWNPHDGELLSLTSQHEWERALQLQQQWRSSSSSSSSSSSASPVKSKVLLVFAQVMTAVASSMPTTAACTSLSTTSNSNSTEERLARVEELLLSLAGKKLVDHKGERATTATDMTMSPPTSSSTGSLYGKTTPTRDYTALVKDRQASLTTRINKVKQMNDEVSKSVPSSPARPLKVLASSGRNGNNNTTTTRTTTENNASIISSDTLQDFLHRMIQERQAGMQQFMESRSHELQAWNQAQEALQTRLETRLQHQQEDLHQKLQHHKQEVTELVSEKLEKMQQHRLVAQARDSVATTEAMEKATQSMMTSLQTHLQQWQDTLQQKLEQIEERQQLHQEQTPSPSSSSSSSSIASLEQSLQQMSESIQTRLDNLEENMMSLKHNTTPSPIVAESSSSSSAPSTSTNTTPPTTTITTLDDASLETITTFVHQRLHKMELHVESELGQRFATLEQQLEAQNLHQLNVLTTASTSSSLDAALLQTMEHKLQQAIADLQQSLQASLHDSIVTEVTKQIAHQIASSQTAIMTNEKQYASALRQAMIRLHQETRHELATAMAQTMKKQLSTIIHNNNSTTMENSADWEAVKQVILSSHDELRTSHEAAITEHKNYLVECIELAQDSILTKLAAASAAPPSRLSSMEERIVNQLEQIQAQATAAILDRVDQALARRQRWTTPASLLPPMSGGVTTNLQNNADHQNSTHKSAAVMVEDDSDHGGGGVPIASATAATASTMNSTTAGVGGGGGLAGMRIAAGGTGAALGEEEEFVTLEQMEELIFAAMEKLEDAMETNCEHIQAQATAVILEQIETAQGAVVDKVETSQAALDGKIVESTRALKEALQSKAQKTQHNNNHDDTKQQLQRTQGAAPHTSPQRISQQQQPQQLPMWQQQQSSAPRPPPKQEAQSQYGQPHTNHHHERQQMQQSPVLGIGMSVSSRSHHDDHGIQQHTRRPPTTSDRPRADGYTVQRFLNMETRAYRLEAAYDCIKHNKPLLDVLSVEEVEDAVLGEQRQNAEEEKKDSSGRATGVHPGRKQKDEGPMGSGHAAANAILAAYTYDSDDGVGFENWI